MSPTDLTRTIRSLWQVVRDVRRLSLGHSEPAVFDDVVAQMERCIDEVEHGTVASGPPFLNVRATSQDLPYLDLEEYQLAASSDNRLLSLALKLNQARGQRDGYRDQTIADGAILREILRTLSAVQDDVDADVERLRTAVQAGIDLARTSFTPRIGDRSRKEAAA